VGNQRGAVVNVGGDQVGTFFGAERLHGLMVAGKPKRETGNWLRVKGEGESSVARSRFSPLASCRFRVPAS
jgi:hypothetical protein